MTVAEVIIRKTTLLEDIQLLPINRLRAEPITHSPKVVATISDSIRLARMVLERINAERP